MPSFVVPTPGHLPISFKKNANAREGGGWGHGHFRENIKLTMKLFDALISPILFYASEVWRIDCTGKLEKDTAELVQHKFLKVVVGSQ